MFVQVKKLMQMGPLIKKNTYSLTPRKHYAIVALGVYLLESNLQVSFGCSFSGYRNLFLLQLDVCIIIGHIACWSMIEFLASFAKVVPPNFFQSVLLVCSCVYRFTQNFLVFQKPQIFSQVQAQFYGFEYKLQNFFNFIDYSDHNDNFFNH